MPYLSILNLLCKIILFHQILHQSPCICNENYTFFWPPENGNKIQIYLWFYQINLAHYLSNKLNLSNIETVFWVTVVAVWSRLNHVLNHTHSCWVSHTFWPPASTTHPTLWIRFALFLGIPKHCYSTFGMTFHNWGACNLLECLFLHCLCPHPSPSSSMLFLAILGPHSSSIRSIVILILLCSFMRSSGKSAC